jgi:uncharacterized lipoprotein
MRPPIGLSLRTLVLVLLIGSLSACSWIPWIHHSSNPKSGCKEPQVDPRVQSLPQLQVPTGLDAPDTRTGVKVPPLAEPETVRAATDPCLTRPPPYK